MVDGGIERRRRLTCPVLRGIEEVSEDALIAAGSEVCCAGEDEVGRRWAA